MENYILNKSLIVDTFYVRFDEFIGKEFHFKLSKQQQFVCTYADHFSTIELVLFGKILRYIGLEVATYKTIQLFEPAELGYE